MDKIKAFFENKVTKIVSWVVLALAVVSLIIGGVTAETINSGVALVAGIVAAIAAFIAFICGQVKKIKITDCLFKARLIAGFIFKF